MDLKGDGLNDQTVAWIDHLGKIPPPKPPVFDALDRLEQCGCGKMKAIRNFSVKDSGVVKYLDNICHECPHTADLEQQAVIICAQCKKVAGRMEPVKDPTGFEFKSGKTYHTDQCPFCNPSLTKFPIIEKLLYDRKRGVQS